ncbi:MAG: DUF5939 domain-containing protein [Anaerolineae bacterium]
MSASKPTRTSAKRPSGKPTTTQTVVTRRRQMGREYHYRWVWQARSSPEALWPYAASTDRFNRDTSVPAIQMIPVDRELPNHLRRLKMHRFQFGPLKLVPIVWTESPFEWIKPQKFGVVRNYTQGPVAYMRTLTELRPRAEGGTEIVYEVWAAPRNLLGMAAIPFQIGLLSARNFRRAFMNYDRMAVAHRTLEADLTQMRPALAPGGRARLMKAARQLDLRGVNPALTTRLVGLLERGDDLSLARIRPYALADAWQITRRLVLEMFLHATRLGMVDSRWELLCPLCRGAKATAKELSEIPQHVHCDVCHIDYEVNFDESVELVFSPNPSVRHIDNAEYCIGGPQVTPHVVIQQLVKRGSGITVPAPMEIGRYRVRTSELGGSQFLLVDVSGRMEAAFTASADGWGKGDTVIRPDGAIRFENFTKQDQLFILERMAWSDQAATAADVTTLQLFRDLFSRDVLRADVQIGIHSLTMMFTDLRDSTAMYREIGDASAFGIVMNHFDVLRSVISREGGSVVKTNGDAVMAVFRRPIQAVRAALEAQHILANPPNGGKALSLKIGLHTGSCIAVNLNDRLDYFGSVVNMAARLEMLSKGDDLVMTPDVYFDPEVVEFFGRTSEHEVYPFSAALKGFGDKSYELWRVNADLSAVKDTSEEQRT